MFMSYIVYSGSRDLYDAIRKDFEKNGYQFVWDNTPEAAKAIAKSGGEHVTIDYAGGDTALVAEVPHTSPKEIPVPRDRSGKIPSRLAGELIRSYIEGENVTYVAKLEEEAVRLGGSKP